MGLDSYLQIKNRNLQKVIKIFKDKEGKIDPKYSVDFYENQPKTMIGHIAATLQHSLKEKQGKSLYNYIEEKLGISLKELQDITSECSFINVANYLQGILDERNTRKNNGFYRP